MKNLTFKIFVALLAFTTGIISLWAVGGFSLFAPIPELPTPHIQESSVQIEEPLQIDEPFEAKKSGNIEVHFKQFTKDENGTIVAAEFGLINDSTENLEYSDCFHLLKRGKKIDIWNRCYCGNDLGLSSRIKSGETKVIKLYIGMIRDGFRSKKQKITGRFGFQVRIGAERQDGKYEDRRLWSENITIPE